MTGGLEGQVEGKRVGAVKTMIAFHQVRPIFYSSLKQSNLQKDNYALAPFYLLEGEWCQGLIAAVLLPPPLQITHYRHLFAITAELGNQLTPPPPFRP